MKPLAFLLLAFGTFLECQAFSWRNETQRGSWEARSEHLLLLLNTTTALVLGGTNGSVCFSEVKLWNFPSNSQALLISANLPDIDSRQFVEVIIGDD